VQKAAGQVNFMLQMMAEEAGLPLVTPDRMVNSRRALEASEFAREMGQHDLFHRIVFRKFYGEGQNMYAWDVLRAAAQEAGLDPDEMQARTEQGDFTPVVTATIERAVRMGIRGVPAYVFDHEYLVSGAQPYPVFQQVMQQLNAQKK
jgi:predicted DsbA family dithiol-disulfide isomerase